MTQFKHTHIVVEEQQGRFTWPVGTKVSLAHSINGFSYYKDAHGNMRSLWNNEVMEDK